MDRAAPPGAAVEWRFDPRREHPAVAVWALACALGTCALVALARLPFVLMAALVLACVASFAPALAPVECRIDGSGIAWRGLAGWRRRPWSVVARLDRVRGGLLVSPFPRPHPLDFTRAALLPMPSSRREELRAAVLAMRPCHDG
jgi:hypothetical protein